MLMTIIVTGGAGFIGSNFIFYMLKEHPQDRIVCLDSLTYAGNLSTLAPVMDQPNFRFVKLDICDRPGSLCSVGADQYMPPMPPALAAAAAAASAAGSGLSATMDSVVRTQAPMDAAFSSAVRVTFVGSTIPAGIMSQ